MPGVLLCTARRLGQNRETFKNSNGLPLNDLGEPERYLSSTENSIHSDSDLFAAWTLLESALIDPHNNVQVFQVDDQTIKHRHRHRHHGIMVDIDIAGE